MFILMIFLPINFTIIYFQLLPVETCVIPPCSALDLSQPKMWNHRMIRAYNPALSNDTVVELATKHLQDSFVDKEF